MEIDDELDKDKPGVSGLPLQKVPDNTATDARQNVVDTEGDPWIGSQQVDRVSHPEDLIQRPSNENQTSGGCKVSNGAHGCLGGCLILLLIVSLMNRNFDWISIIDQERSFNEVSHSKNFVSEIHLPEVIDLNRSENFDANVRMLGNIQSCNSL